MRTLVFQTDDRELVPSGYPFYSSEINKRYAERNGYDYRFVHVPPTDRHPSWSKLWVAATLVQTSGHDLYVYVDTDCAFVDQGKAIEQYLSTARYVRKSPGSAITFLNDRPWSAVEPCAGFFVFTRKALQLLHHWWGAVDDVHAWQHPWEQSVLRERVAHTFPINVIDDAMFYDEPGQFLRHYGLPEADVRLEKLRGLYDVR